MPEVVSVGRDGAAAARAALERCISGGGVAVFPADGLYGLAADPLNADAVDRIQRLKGRAESKPSAVMYFTVLAMRELLDGIGPLAGRVMGELLPGPVTLLLANPSGRYPLASRDDVRRLGVRLIEGPLAGARCVVFQTSANPSGEPAPRRLGEVDETLLAEIDLAIDGGELSGLPSTVVDISSLDAEGGWSILREGGLSADQVAEVVDRALADRR
jgi:L-threonylcarbamoyladenylate synthase